MSENEEIRRIQIKDIPGELLHNAGKEALNYTIGIMGIKTNLNGEYIYDEKSWLIGTGVLIQVGQVKGILTAYHLASSFKFNNSNLIGLNILTARPHRFVTHIKSADIITIAIPVSPILGPDLAFIRLYDEDIGSIEAYSQKRFWNIDKTRDRMLNEPPNIDMGTWAILGYPEEKSRKTGPKNGFLEKTSLLLIATFTEITDIKEREGFDFMDARIIYDGDALIPLSYQGVSGSGLWHFPNLKCISGKWEIGEPLLSGIAFYQTELEDNIRNLRCHGPKSIYDIVFNAIKEKP
jgi:hypothetical protein